MSTNDKTNGPAIEAVGNVKQETARAVGSEKRRAEGAVPDVKGDGQKEMHKIKDSAKDVVNAIAKKADRKV